MHSSGFDIKTNTKNKLFMWSCGVVFDGAGKLEECLFYLNVICSCRLARFVIICLLYYFLCTYTNNKT